MRDEMREAMREARREHRRQRGEHGLMWGVHVGSRDRDGVIWGLMLIAMGVMFMLVQLGLLSRDYWHAGWPIVVIVMGLGQLIVARSPHKVESGVTLALMGVWFLIATRRWHGLGWSESWPLALVAGGAGMVARAIAAQFMRPKAEADDATA